jgi:hypothetical protein
MNLKEVWCDCRLYFLASGYCSVTGSCEHGNERLGSIKGREFHGQILNKNSDPRSYFFNFNITAIN